MKDKISIRVDNGAEFCVGSKRKLKAGRIHGISQDHTSEQYHEIPCPSLRSLPKRRLIPNGMAEKVSQSSRTLKRW